MGSIRRFFSLNQKAPYEPAPEPELTMKDLMRFMEKQQEQNMALLQAVVQTSNMNAETMKNYIELFKPRQVKSTTLEEREQAKMNKVDVRESEWEGIATLQDFNSFTASGIPKDIEEL